MPKKNQTSEPTGVVTAPGVQVAVSSICFSVGPPLGGAKTAAEGAEGAWAMATGGWPGRSGELRSVGLTSHLHGDIMVISWT